MPRTKSRRSFKHAVSIIQERGGADLDWGGNGIGEKLNSEYMLRATATGFVNRMEVQCGRNGSQRWIQNFSLKVAEVWDHYSKHPFLYVMW